MKSSSVALYDYCIRNHRQELLEQWEREENLPNTPETVSWGSHYFAHWRCEKGHRWAAQVKSRVQGTGCPVCTGRTVIAGENDLATTHPKLAAQWDREKNAPLRPQQVVSGSARKVWWRCRLGHSWESAINSRAAGFGCPYCSSRKVLTGFNDLATINPELAQRWDYEKNVDLTPQQVTAFSNRYVWWKCPAGHSYHSLIRATGCPYCAGRKVFAGFNDLAFKRPDVPAEWCERLNAPLTPQDVTVASHRKVWWECRVGHVWKAVIYSRTDPKPSGCPVCARKRKEAKENAYEKFLIEDQAERAAAQTPAEEVVQRK